MTVLRLAPRSNRETVEALEWMLQEARKGRIPDIISLFPDKSGVEVAVVTGRYKADASKALMAVMRMSAALTKD